MHTGYPQALNVTIATKPSGKIKKASCVRYASVSNIQILRIESEMYRNARRVGWLCPRYHQPANLRNSKRTPENDLKIIHFSNQSMVSSFYEFQVLVSQLPMDIIAMSETWLRNNPALLDLRYTACLHSSLWKLRRYSRWRRGAFIRFYNQFKRRKDISNFNRRWNTYGSKFQDVVRIARLWSESSTDRSASDWARRIGWALLRHCWIILLFPRTDCSC